MIQIEGGALDYLDDGLNDLDDDLDDLDYLDDDLNDLDDDLAR